MVGILISFWDGLFSGAMLVSGSVCLACEIGRFWSLPRISHLLQAGSHFIHFTGPSRACGLEFVFFLSPTYPPVAGILDPDPLPVAYTHAYYFFTVSFE